METGVIETGVIETNVIETGVIETGMIETGVIDTGGIETKATEALNSSREDVEVVVATVEVMLGNSAEQMSSSAKAGREWENLILK